MQTTSSALPGACSPLPPSILKLSLQAKKRLHATTHERLNWRCTARERHEASERKSLYTWLRISRRLRRYKKHSYATPLDLLQGKCKEVIIHDPHVKNFEGVPITNDLEEALRSKDCIAIVTSHKEYRDLSLDWLRDVLDNPIIVDGRNVFNPEECIEAGFVFRGIGIGSRK